MSFQKTVLRKSAYLRYEDSRRVLLLDSVCCSTGLDRFAVHSRKCRALLQWQYRNASLLESDNATAPVQVELQQVGTRKICCTFQQVTTPCSSPTAVCSGWVINCVYFLRKLLNHAITDGKSAQVLQLNQCYWRLGEWNTPTAEWNTPMLSILDWKQSVCGNQLSSRKRRLFFLHLRWLNCWQWDIKALKQSQEEPNVGDLRSRGYLNWQQR